MNDEVKPDADTGIAGLLRIMARLRTPKTGCPWDLEQNFASIAPYTIEEAYEVAEAIREDDMPGLRDELGDLLFQVVFHARIAEEAGDFGFGDVVEAISEKMVRRHPHVFGDAKIYDAAAQTTAWEAHKAAERAAKSHGGEPESVLASVPLALPALTRAEKLQKRAARVGFDWPEAAQVLDKIEEELAELREALAQKAPREKIAEELGDILFGYVNVARHLGVDPEDALRSCNAKFVRRFQAIEKSLAAEGRGPQDASLDEMEALWQAAKKAE
ncbi:MAG: nucleoside triphosphate pyrophosphohydrolase [Proteobacteria bacterium]|nr:nucleoside triphosphate pyrophosphohydrolase [Pseudomonadota bacterium]